MICKYAKASRSGVRKPWHVKKQSGKSNLGAKVKWPSGFKPRNGWFACKFTGKGGNIKVAFGLTILPPDEYGNFTMKIRKLK